MKTIAVTGTSAICKNTVLSLLCQKLPHAELLRFDDFSYRIKPGCEALLVDAGAECGGWDLSPLEAAIHHVMKEGNCEWLLLDYPFAYLHPDLRHCIDKAVFIDTPLDIALAQRILEEEMHGEEIRTDMALYLQHARPALLQLKNAAMPSSDYVVNGDGTNAEISNAVLHLICE